MPTNEETIREIRKQAAAAHAAYPQYKGYWDGPEWVLVRITAKVRTKLGQAFSKGELALAKPGVLEGKVVWCAYSLSNQCNTIIDHKRAVPV